jgi:AmiR/NasT family two-component response regulator
MPDTPMPATLRFMLAARRSELQGLKSLASTCRQVTDISRLVHALQRERGYSNLFLGSRTPAHYAEMQRLSHAALAMQAPLLEGLQAMDLQEASAADRARLFNRIAFVLHCFDELPGLRRRIHEQRIEAPDATAALTRVITALLAVVFEAADSAIDPAITRVLVALFNFMQGKELAGQERATGVAGFAAGYFDDSLRTRLEHLVHSQERCFQTFIEFADVQARGVWLGLQASEPVAQVGQLRQMALRTHATATVDPALSTLWFDLASERIDRMREVESYLAEQLLEQCRLSIGQAHSDLDNHRALLQRLAHLDVSEQACLFSVQAVQLDGPAADAMGPQLGRSLLELLQAQTQRLQTANEELDLARQSLNERKLIERAKQVLMQQLNLNEAAAHGRLQQSAMDRGERLGVVAQRVLDAAHQPGARR